MATNSFSVDSVKSINKTTAGTTVDGVVISAGKDTRRQWTVEIWNWSSVDLWVSGGAQNGAYGSDATVAIVPDPVANADNCYRVKPSTAKRFETDQANQFIAKILSTSGNADYSVEVMEERPEVES